MCVNILTILFIIVLLWHAAFLKTLVNLAVIPKFPALSHTRCPYSVTPYISHSALHFRARDQPFRLKIRPRSQARRRSCMHSRVMARACVRFRARLVNDLSRKWGSHRKTGKPRRAGGEGGCGMETHAGEDEG